MTEKIKSIVLAILVCISLLQSYFLAYRMPKFESINRGDYVETELSGSQATLNDVIFPEQIILHFGKKSHTVLYPMPFINHYRNIFDFLKQRTFNGLKKTNVFTANLNWEDIRDNQQGIEIRFREGVPLSVLRGFMSITTDEEQTDNDLITKIWIFSSGNKEEVKTFFVSDANVNVYEAVKADVTAQDLEVRLRLGESLPKYHTNNGEYYVPDSPLPSIKITMPYTQYSAEQLKRSLFVDPGLTRSLLERDGSQIFTDSKRGLQLRNNQHWFVFSDPAAAPVDSKNEIKDNLLSAVQFINQHGGWNSTYMYELIAPKQASGPQTLIFRLYLEGLPVMNVRQENFGFIKLIVQKGIVSHYERSMILPDAKGIVKQEADLAGGKELDELIANYSHYNPVIRIFPGYRAFVKEKQVEFVPNWFVERSDGSFDVLESEP